MFSNNNNNFFAEIFENKQKSRAFYVFCFFASVFFAFFSFVRFTTRETRVFKGEELPFGGVLAITTFASTLYKVP